MPTTIPRNRTSGRARRLRGGAVVLVLAGLGGLAAGTTVGAAPPAPSPQADAAIDWLGAQLSAHGDTMPGFTPGSSDWGLTADAVLAFVAAGRGADAPAQAATDQLTTHVVEYTTWDPDVPGVRVAGATGKVLLTLLSQGRDVSNVSGVDLEDEVRSLMVTSGADAGRFADRVPDPTWDASNGFGQTLSMLGLALTDDGVPAESVAFLLAQQCPAGGFRLTYATTPGCVSDASADTDTTALSLQALLAAERTVAVDAALVRGLQWLSSIQDTATGAFGGTGPTASLNANSTGLIAQTLRAAGQTAAADAGAAWITSTLQLTTANATGTPAAPDLGAIAYQRAPLDAALSGGIDSNSMDQWRRATSQAVLALGLAPYGPVDTDPVVVPTTSTTTSTTTTPTSTTTPTTTPVVSDGVGGTPTPTGVASTSAGASGGTAAGSVGTTSAGSTGSTGSTNAQGATRLATTGDEAAPLTQLGALLVLAGVALLGAGTLGTRRVRS